MNMSVSQSNSNCFLGFDVSKDTIAVFDTRSGQCCDLANKARDIMAFLKNYGSDIQAICEPTGGYEAVLLNTLVKAGIPVHRADTVRVKAYIRSLGTLAKTDQIDARGLAFYAQERWNKLSLWQPNDQQAELLQSLVLRRQDLVAMRVAETNRLKAPDPGGLKKSYQTIIKALTSQIIQLEEQIEELISQTDTLNQEVKTLMSIPGIGKTTAVSLCAMMPELGHLTAKKAASLAGLAPHPKDSGTIRKYRRVRGGRTQIPKLIFMAAMAAARGNNKLGDFYRSLLKRGKKKLVALTAVMRKIIVIANARLRDLRLQQQS